MLDIKNRHYCLNPRCRAKLKEPVENRRHAFCCRGCFDGYFRARCIVCEAEFNRASSTQKLCGRRKCRRELNRNPVVFSSPWGVRAARVTLSLPGPESSQKTPEKSTMFWCDRGGRGWRWVAAADQHHLQDREGRIAARLCQEGEGWWIARPLVHPELPIYPTLDAAKRAGLNVALWALPRDGATRRSKRACTGLGAS
jgi:hypothetical protein